MSEKEPIDWTPAQWQARNIMEPRVPGLSFWARATLNVRSIKHRWSYDSFIDQFHSLCGMVVHTPARFGPWNLEEHGPWCDECEDRFFGRM
jgi:hypothetical protein